MQTASLCNAWAGRQHVKLQYATQTLPGLCPGGRTFGYHDAAGMAALPASGRTLAQGLMRAALPRALLPLALLLLLPGLPGAQRPSYAPVSAQYYIKNGYLVFDLVYENFQGYFLNTYTLPAGAARVQLTAVLAFSYLPAGPAFCEQPRVASRARLQGRLSLTRPMARPGGRHKTLC